MTASRSRSIALIHYSTPPIVGGVESVLAHHARLMADAGHDVRVLAGRGELWDERIRLIRLPLMDSRHPEVLAVKTELDVGRAPPRFSRLVKEIASVLHPALADVDILIAHNVCSLHKNLALTAALHSLRQTAAFPKLILWHHDLAWTTPRYRSELHDGWPWDLLRMDWGGRHVVVSEFRRRELAGLLHISAQSIVVVPNGVETRHLLKLEPQTQMLFEKLKLAEAEPLLLLPVRLTPRKNIELALRAQAELRRDLPQAALVVTGPEGPHNPANAEYKRSLLTLRDELGLKGVAHFVAEHADALSGAEGLPDSVVADFFRLADALLLTSREEGFGIPLLEAAIARLPIFCADIPPLRDLGGEDVTRFSPEAEPKIVAGLIASRLQADPAYRFAVRARQRFTWEKVYNEHIAPLLKGADL
ncbi:MAG: glycosyltransferase family 4 protein [Chloroflexi bacterium]|nr:glycosyltransferase family 4 protein [Chloroflexota bacterium]